MKPITDEELQEAFDRCERATEGPWEYFERDNVVVHDSRYAPEIAEEIGHAFDGEFIAHAREDVPRLVAEVKRLREKLELIQRNRFLVGELAYITARDALGNAGKSYDQIYGKA